MKARLSTTLLAAAVLAAISFTASSQTHAPAEVATCNGYVFASLDFFTKLLKSNEFAESEKQMFLIAATRYSNMLDRMNAAGEAARKRTKMSSEAYDKMANEEVKRTRAHIQKFNSFGSSVSAAETVKEMVLYIEERGDQLKCSAIR